MIGRGYCRKTVERTAFMNFKSKVFRFSVSRTRASPLRENLLLVLGDRLGHHQHCLGRPPRHGFEDDRPIHHVRVRGVDDGRGSSAHL
jgi:hypothetical protein